jgi:outer membrane protein assembly factor BamA
VDITSKFTVKANAGAEDRQFEDAGSLTTPIFELTGDYKPLDGLDLSLTAYRRVLNSAFYSDYDYIGTGIDAGVQYQFSSQITVLLNGGYENSAYRAITTGAGISRTDDYYYVRPAVRYIASSYCNVEIYCFYRRDDSTVATSCFHDIQAGATLNFTY